MTQPGMAMAPAAQAPTMPGIGGLSSAAGVPTIGNASNVAGTAAGMDGALAQAFGQDATQALSNVTLPPGYDQTSINPEEMAGLSLGSKLRSSATAVGALGGVAAKTGAGQAAAGSLSKAVASGAGRMAVSSAGKRVAASTAGRAVAGFGARLAARAAITAPLNAVPIAGQVAYVAVMVGLILTDPLIRRGIRALFRKPNINIDSPPTPPNQFLPMWGNRTDDDIKAQDANLVNANNSMFSFDPARVGPNKDRVDPSTEIVQAAKLEELATMADNANSHYDSTVAELSNVLNKYMGEQYVERTAQLATPLISAMQDAPQKAILPSLQGLVNAGMGINEAYVGFHEVIMKTREEIVNSGDGIVPFYRPFPPRSSVNWTLSCPRRRKVSVRQTRCCAEPCPGHRRPTPSRTSPRHSREVPPVRENPGSRIRTATPPTSPHRAVSPETRDRLADPAVSPVVIATTIERRIATTRVTATRVSRARIRSTTSLISFRSRQRRCRIKSIRSTA